MTTSRVGYFKRLTVGWLLLMEEQFIPDKIFTGWSITQGNRLSPEGEKKGHLLVQLHIPTPQCLVLPGLGWVGTGTSGHPQLPQTLPACRAAALSTSLVSSLHGPWHWELQH